MSIRLKAFFITLISLIVITVAVVSFSTNNAYTVSTQNSEFKPTVVIDPGHGGEDGGATANNVLEKDINLQISQKLCDLLKLNGFNVVMTRSTDTGLYSDNAASSKKRAELSNRVKIFNEFSSNIVISIHQNKFTDQKYFGTQVFYSNNDPKSEYLAECIKTGVVNLIQPDNTRECKKAGSEIFVLDNANVPAVMVECGFLSNKEEAEKLSDNEYQNKMAYSIYLGFLEFYYTNY